MLKLLEEHNNYIKIKTNKSTHKTKQLRDRLFYPASSICQSQVSGKLDRTLGVWAPFSLVMVAKCGKFSANMRSLSSIIPPIADL